MGSLARHVRKQMPCTGSGWEAERLARKLPRSQSTTPASVKHLYEYIDLTLIPG